MTLQVRWCPQCGTRRTGYFRFCGRCGLDFDEVTLRPNEWEAESGAKPEPTTPIWPLPIQWPPHDALPAAEVTLEAVGVAPAAVDVAPATASAPAPAPVPPAPVEASAPAPPTSAPSTPPDPGLDWPTRDRTTPGYVQAPAQRPILARGLATAAAPPVIQPAPAPLVSTGRPAITFTRIAILVLAAFLVFNAVSRAISQSASTSQTPPPTTEAGSPLVGASASTEPSAERSFAAITPGPSFAPVGDREYAEVTKVIDGDTIEVDLNGSSVTVRYAGIEAPSVDTTDPVLKQVADKATATNAQLLEGGDIYLERDATDKDGDSLLRYVWFTDSGGGYVLVNLELVRLGLATAVKDGVDTRYLDYLATAEAAAQSEKRGIWAN
jgi:endonuclease YncB( thermonuclease family)